MKNLLKCQETMIIQQEAYQITQIIKTYKLIGIDLSRQAHTTNPQQIFVWYPSGAQMVLKWCPSDKDSKSGQDIDTFTTTFGYTQMIGEPVHIMNDKSSCIDLLFTTNSKLLYDVEQTIYNKCHHNIING